jgi:hypothetical protein
MKVLADAASSFTSPVLAQGRIHCRSYEGEVVCLAAAADRAASDSSVPGMRTWTHDRGRYRIEAALIAVDGGRVRLRKASGQEIEVPLSRLSREDRQWAQRRAAEATPR